MSSKSKAKKRKSQDSSDDEQGTTASDTIDFKAVKRNGALKHNFHRLCTDEVFIRPEMFDYVDPKDFNIDYFERNGLTKPILFKCKPEELGMMMPNPEEFSEDNVLELVGAKRFVEVVVVDEQSGRSVPLETMIDYYKNPEGRELTNMLSLEFSLTKLRDIVSGPSVVNELDWVGKYFPDELCTRSTNFNLKSNYSFNVNYPAVQRFCLMGTPGCYTDFHLDFGGTSVWYHVLHGKKIFFLVEPTEQNLLMYDQWQRNYDVSGWFGDIVEKCARMEINAGDTAILPSGWIHAVYTPVRSLVFGGNYLHTYSAAMQCKVQNMESKLRIAAKYRYPFFEELHFFLVANIVEECTGRQYIRPTKRTQTLEYVGKEWIADGGHCIPISWEHYNTLMTERRKTRLEEKDGLPTTEPESFPSGPLIFFDPSSEIRARGKAYNHKDPPGVEPEIIFIKEGMERITCPLLMGYEAILDFLWSKKCVELPDQITRPSSLLFCFQFILAKRRAQLIAMGNILPPPPTSIVMSQSETDHIRVSNSSTPSDAETACSTRSEELGSFEEVKNYNYIISSTMDAEEENQILSATEKFDPSTSNAEVKDETKDKPNQEAKDESVTEEKDDKVNGQKKDEEEEKANQEAAEEGNEKDDVSGAKTAIEDTPTEEAETKRKRGRPKKSSSPILKTSAQKAKTPKPKKVSISEEEKKKGEKRKSGKERLSFDEALNPPKPKKKHDPKKDKPEFVGGIPVAPIQNKPAVPNAYNYDPMQEIMKLGTGQLQSTYRKSVFTIAPPKQNKIYKLEHKTSTDKEENNSDIDQNIEQIHENQGSLMPDFNNPPPHPTFDPYYSSPPMAMERRMSEGIMPGHLDHSGQFLPAFQSISSRQPPINDLNSTQSQPQFNRHYFSPSVSSPENRRVSTGSMDRPAEFGIRERALSLNTSGRSDSFDSPNNRSKPTTSIPNNSPACPKAQAQLDIAAFIQRARELTEELVKLNKK